jgi:quinol monooxygenase YgiN
MNSAVVLASVFEAAPESVEEFHAQLSSFRAELAEQPDCERAEAHRGHENMRHFLLIQRWANLNAFYDNRRLPYFTRFYDYARVMTRGELGDTIWIVADHVSPQAARELVLEDEGRGQKRRKTDELEDDPLG